MQRLRLIQLPVPPPAALASTGNVPLAAGSLAVSARVHGLTSRLLVDVVPPSTTDALGDALLCEVVSRDEPEFLGLSLYLWNVERSLHLAREVKRRSPRTKVIVGGPEVGSDNPFVLSQSGFDIAVTGEAEASFAALMEALLSRRDPAGLPGVAVHKPLGMSPFGPPADAAFPLDQYPSPYLEGAVPVDPTRSTYVETVRGCRSHCTFCFYPRSSSVLRTLEPEAAAGLVGTLRDRGAREIVFLDPTFNHRPGFVPLLDALAEVNAGRPLSFFAEIRAEGLTADHASRLERAGFTKLEIGLQSVNRETLKRVRRGGSPELVARAARMLHEHGLELLVDLIVGLPGDTVDDVLRGVDFLQENGLGSEAQVFPLSLLPGTAMRATAAADGVDFDPAPPYRVRRTATMNAEQIRFCIEEAEARLGRRVDEMPRPHLVATASDPADVFVFDVDDPDLSRMHAPGAQHCALWIIGRDLFAHRAAALTAIDARVGIDPHATLDVVLAPRHQFPVDLLEAIRARLDAAPPSYASRALAHRGENLQRRLCVVLSGDGDPDWVEAVRRHARVFRDQSWQRALRDAERLGGDLPGARITDVPPPEAFRDLQRLCDADAVSFADRATERAWQAEMLG
ncbi:MAG TPA: radical SAM protein [Myxococcales bacterium]|nr:radical SAM protein [Myxococcales bacterium]